MVSSYSTKIVGAVPVKFTFTFSLKSKIIEIVSPKLYVPSEFDEVTETTELGVLSIVKLMLSVPEYALPIISVPETVKLTIPSIPV